MIMDQHAFIYSVFLFKIRTDGEMHGRRSDLIEVQRGREKIPGFAEWDSQYLFPFKTVQAHLNMGSGYDEPQQQQGKIV